MGNNEFVECRQDEGGPVSGRYEDRRRWTAISIGRVSDMCDRSGPRCPRLKEHMRRTWLTVCRWPIG